MDQNHPAAPPLYQVWMLLHVVNQNVVEFGAADFSTASLNERDEILLVVDGAAMMN